MDETLRPYLSGSLEVAHATLIGPLAALDPPPRHWCHVWRGLCPPRGRPRQQGRRAWHTLLRPRGLPLGLVVPGDGLARQSIVLVGGRAAGGAALALGGPGGSGGVCR